MDFLWHWVAGRQLARITGGLAGAELSAVEAADVGQVLELGDGGQALGHTQRTGAEADLGLGLDGNAAAEDLGAADPSGSHGAQPLETPRHSLDCSTLLSGHRGRETTQC